jgi:hypothetical protein
MWEEWLFWKYNNLHSKTMLGEFLSNNNRKRLWLFFGIFIVLLLAGFLLKYFV